MHRRTKKNFLIMFFKRFAKRAPVIFRRQQKKITRLFRIFKKNILKPFEKYLSRKYATIKNPILLTRLATILVIISMIGGFGYRVFATPLYQPGETLNPTCGPSTTDCTVSVMGITTSGTTNYLIKWGSATAGTNSVVYDDGTNVGIGTATPLSKLDILPTGTFSVAGVSGVTTRAHTVTLSGVDPTTYATFSANQIGALTLVGTNANQTVTNAAALHLTSAPVKSTNVALTNTHGLLISAGAVSTATNSYGLTVNAQTGATNNYSAAFLGGNVGVGTATPEVRLDVRTSSDGQIAYFIGASQHGVVYGTNTAASVAYLSSATSLTSFGFGINGNYDAWHIATNNNIGLGTTSPNANLQVVQPDAGTGTVTVLAGTPTTVTGTNTQFTNTFKVGDTITISGESRVITAIGNNTSLTVGSSFSAVANSAYSLTGGTRFAVLGNGNVGIGTVSPLSKLHIASAPTASANYGTFSVGGGAFDGATSGFFTGTASGTSIAVNEASGFTGNLIDLQVGGTSMFKVTQAGEMSGVGFNASYYTSAGANGYIITGVGRLKSGGGNGIFQLTNNEENDFSRIQFGGSTSSFPALKRSANGLVVRLADDSANAPLTAARGAFTSVPTASASLATLSVGSGGFGDASTSGYFNGNSLGTSIGVNEVTGYEGSLLDLQVGGVSKFKIDYNGSLNPVNGVGTLGTLTNRFGAIYLQSGLFNTNNAMLFETTMSGTGGNGFKFQNSLTTNGTANNDFVFMAITNTFNPTSGGAKYHDILLDSEISQTGGANGVTSSITIRPHISLVADYRAIHITPSDEQNATNFYAVYIANTEGYGIYQDGSTTTNYFAGNLGIGDTTPSFKLDVATDASSTYSANFFNDGNNDNRYGIVIQAGADTPSAGKWIQFNDGDGGDVGSICYTGGQANVCAPSDERLKNNNPITDTTIGLTDLMSIKVRDFYYNANPENLVHGFVAQELYESYPDAVFAPTNPNEYWKVSYSQLTPLIVKSIQDLNIKVEGISALFTSQAGVLSMMSDFFSSVVVRVSGGVADLKNITVETLKIGKENKRTGIIFYDETDGTPYCFSIIDGKPTATKAESGECSVIEITPPSDEEGDTSNTGGGVSGDGNDASGNSDVLPPDDTDDTVVTDPLPPTDLPPSDEEEQIISSDDTTSNENDTPPETQIP